MRAFVIAAMLLAAAGVARAEAKLEALGAGPVREVAHELAIRFDGLVAEVEVEQILANGGAGPAEAIYTVELPARAAVTDLAVTLADGRRTVAAAVGAEAAVRPVAEPEAVVGAPDAGLLRLIAADIGDGSDLYELRVYPIAAGKTVRVRWRYAVPLAFADGRLTLRLPDRGDAANLARERVRLTLAGPHQSVTGGGALLAARTRGGSYRFRAPVGGDLVVQAAPTWRGKARAEVAAVQLGPDFGVAAVAAWAPAGPGGALPPPKRAVLVVDVSRSLGAAGRAAAAAVAEGLLQALGDGVAVELLTFDRAARRPLGRALANGAAARAAVARALAAAAGENGSDLGAALDAARPLLGAEPALVAVITDGLVPLSLDGDEARRRLGAGAEVAVLTALLVPDGAPVPPPPEPLAALGRVLALRHGEAAARAPGLLAELSQPPPLEALTVEGAGLSGFALPDVPAGSGALAVGVYRGSRPPALAVVGRRGSEPVRLRPRRAPRRRAKLLVRVAAADAGPGQWAGDDADAHAARRRELAAGATLRVVSQASALVAVLAGDGFAAGRLALARRYGSAAYRRLLPPPERLDGGPAPMLDHVDAGQAPPRRRTGRLDRTIVGRVLGQQLLPRARACYTRALRRRGRAGTVVLRLELARGEVHDVRAERADAGLGAALRACAVAAGYQLQVPAVARGDDPEAIYVVRYPLHFGDGGVRAGEPRGADELLPADPDDPLPP